MSHADAEIPFSFPEGAVSIKMLTGARSDKYELAYFLLGDLAVPRQCIPGFGIAIKMGRGDRRPTKPRA